MSSTMKFCLVFLLISIFTAPGNADDDFLREIPKFLNPCLFKDPKLKDCIAKNVELMFSEWKSGVPGLKSAGALDPLHINEVKIENSKSPLAIDVDLKDVEIKGLSSVHMEEPSYDTKKLVFTTKLKVPKFTIKSNYKMKGKIVQLDLNTDGKLELDIEHLIAKVMMKFKLYDRYCHTFTHLEELHLEITDIKGLNIYMTNLFKGQKDLEENLNKQFNDNWKEFYEVLRPTISSTAESVMKYRLGEVFDYVPATYIVSDLPNASSHHKQN